VDPSFVQRRVSNGCTVGSSIRQILEDGSVVCEPDSDSGGDITGVSAGSGLSGGGVVGDVFLAIPTGGITSTHIATGSVGASEIQDGGVGGAEIATNAQVAVANLNVGNGALEVAPATSYVRIGRRLLLQVNSSSFPSGGNLTPEVYFSEGFCTRGEMFVGRVSGEVNQDSLCVCLDVDADHGWYCFNP
jgi:hypothetical protein